MPPRGPNQLGQKIAREFLNSNRPAPAAPSPVAEVFSVIAPQLELVTPAKAAEWLQLNVNNRPMSRRHLDRLIDSINTGHWRQNLGDPIRFDIDGFLCDGQHRLAAIVHTGIALEMFVVRGLPRDSFAYIDGILPRTSSQILACAHIPRYATVAAAARLIFMHINDYLPHRIEPWETVKIIEEYPELPDVASYIGNVPGAGSVIPAGTATGLKVLTDRSDKALSDDFWHKVLVGDNLAADDPEFALRKRLIEARGTRRKGATLKQLDVIAYSLRAWQARKSGKKVLRLIWDGEDMPQVA